MKYVETKVIIVKCPDCGHEVGRIRVQVSDNTQDFIVVKAGTKCPKCRKSYDIGISY